MSHETKQNLGVEMQPMGYDKNIVLALLQDISIHHHRYDIRRLKAALLRALIVLRDGELMKVTNEDRAWWYTGSQLKFRRFDDHELQHALVTLVDYRNHSEGTPPAELDHVMVCAAADVRDERRQLARAIDEATNPFEVIGLTFDNED